MNDSTNSRSSLVEVAGLFFKLGTIAFGGPAAHIAMMQDEVVVRRSWLTHQQFLDLLGATNLIPGPNSTELALHIGHVRAGWRGLIVAGLCFILPATLIVTAFAWAYVRFGKLPISDGMLSTIKPVVIAIIAQALWKLGKTALKSKWLWMLGISSLVACAIGVNELIVLFAAGAVSVLASKSCMRSLSAILPLSSIRNVFTLGATAVGVAAPIGLTPIFWTFAKIGSVLFGSGYVLIAFLRADFVVRLHWLTEKQLIDAVAVGQFTPGPVFTTATFIGYVLAGWSGSVVATVGIFLPAFILVAISGPLIPKLRSSPTTAAVLDGVNVASLALMAFAAVQLTRFSLVDTFSIGLFLLSLFILSAKRSNSAWLIFGAGLLGAAKIAMGW
ncbi:MAG: chromate efflux transporter [Gemmatimonadaceae bacterium]